MMKVTLLVRNQIGFIKQFAGIRSKLIAILNALISTVLIEYLKMGMIAKHFLKRKFKVRVKFQDMLLYLRFPSSDFSALNETCHKMIYDLEENPKGIIFDCGAHIGTFTVKHALDRKNIIYSFEPEPHNYMLLNENVELNCQRNVKTFKIALSDCDGDGLLGVSDSSTVNPSLYGRGGKKIHVNVSTVDSVVENEKIRVVDFMKIDVEGAEINLLKGAFGTLRKFHPKIVVETDDFDGVKKLLARAGYKHFSSWESYSNMEKPNILFCK